MTLWLHGLQHARIPCPSPAPRACSNSCPSSRWCLGTMSCSVLPFPSRPQSFPTSGSFPMSQFLSGGWVLEFQLQHQSFQWIFFRIDWLDLLAVQGTLKSLLQHCSSKASNLQCPGFFIVQISHPYMTTGKIIALALTRWTFAGKVMSLLFNMLSSLVITFLPRSKCLLILWLHSPSAVILEPKKISLSLFPLFPHLFSMKWLDQIP